MSDIETDLSRVKEEVFRANLELKSRGLILQTFGNVSARSEKAELIVIKPSGVALETVTPDDMVIVNLAGAAIPGQRFRPSSDTKTHVELYRAYPEIGGIAHTHSSSATVWAQARRPIPPLGTTHADYFRGAVPVTDTLPETEVGQDYETAIGVSICRSIEASGASPLEIPGVLVAWHGPFTWGRSAWESVEHAEALEYAADLASKTLAIEPECGMMPAYLLDKHFLRKHGPTAYYGQRCEP